MKQFLVFLLLLLAVGLFADTKPQKFKVKFVITFNELTLEDAAKKEVEIKKQFADACKIQVEIEGNNTTSETLLFQYPVQYPVNRKRLIDPKDWPKDWQK